MVMDDEKAKCGEICVINSLQHSKHSCWDQFIESLLCHFFALEFCNDYNGGKHFKVIGSD